MKNLIKATEDYKNMTEWYVDSVKKFSTFIKEEFYKQINMHEVELELNAAPKTYRAGCGRGEFLSVKELKENCNACKYNDSYCCEYYSTRYWGEVGDCCIYENYHMKIEQDSEYIYILNYPLTENAELVLKLYSLDNIYDCLKSIGINDFPDVTEEIDDDLEKAIISLVHKKEIVILCIKLDDVEDSLNTIYSQYGITKENIINLYPDFEEYI